MKRTERIIVAQRSTKGRAIFAKRRWSVLRLSFIEDAPQPYMVEIEAHSAVEGEHVIRTKKRAVTLEEALSRLGRSAPADAIRRQAREWEAARG